MLCWKKVLSLQCCISECDSGDSPFDSILQKRGCSVVCESVLVAMVLSHLCAGAFFIAAISAILWFE